MKDTERNKNDASHIVVKYWLILLNTMKHNLASTYRVYRIEYLKCDFRVHVCKPLIYISFNFYSY